MRRLCLLFLLVFCFSCEMEGSDRVLITVKRNYSIPRTPETKIISIDWTELVRRVPALKKSHPRVTDQNWGKEIEAELIDGNADGLVDNLVLHYTFRSNEPIFTFLIEPQKKELVFSSKKTEPDPQLQISFLTPFPDFEAKKGVVRDVASKIVESTINIYPKITDFPIYAPNRWNYEYSFFLLGSYKLGKIKSNPAFIDYPKKWIDSFITDNNFKEGVYDMSEYKLDDVIPARLAILFHQQTNQPKYKAIADTIALHLERQPRTSDGGYWHKEIYPNQMWLDGVFMGDVFSMQYAQAYNQPEWYDEAVKQIRLIYNHTLDPATGLLYHGWDESKNPVWAHPEKGTSPEFWGRAIGWFVMALVECLDYLPADHPARRDLISMLQNTSSSIMKYQDSKSSLWYQVLDKGDQPGNWIETSCSAMFAYAFAKGFHQGHLEESFLKSAERAYDALLNQYVYVDENGNLHFSQTVKVGTLNVQTSKGDYEYYISTERRIDDYKGLAALLYASIELKR